MLNLVKILWSDQIGYYDLSLKLEDSHIDLDNDEYWDILPTHMKINYKKEIFCSCSCNDHENEGKGSEVKIV